MKTGIFLSGIVFSVLAFAQERFQSQEAPLDPPYHHLRPVTFDQINLNYSHFPQSGENVPPESDTEALIAKQTPVRSQLARGTCSIFASTSLLESMLVLRTLGSVDSHFSEEWLEYSVSYDRSGAEGSDAPTNFAAFMTYGDASQNQMPYIGEDWTELKTELSQKRCGKVPAALRKACLVAHNDPRLMKASDQVLSDPSNPLYNEEFLNARTEAVQFRQQVLEVHAKPQLASISMDEVKSLLARGIPVQVDVDFYYGTWNHRLGPDYGIPRNLSHWSAGIVGYPEIGSRDRKESVAHPEGHSIVLVGYDDNKEIVTTQLMEDGSSKSFTYSGVFYFKNSWGTDGFGINFELNGRAHPGYGMMTQKYAEDFGSFFQFPME